MTLPDVRDARRASGARDALIAWAIVLVLVAALVHVNITLPYLGHLGSALVGALLRRDGPVRVVAGRADR